VLGVSTATSHNRTSWAFGHPHPRHGRFPSSDGTVPRSRLLVTRRFRLPRSRRRQTTPPHSRSSLRLKQETARPSQVSSGRPICPRGIRDFEHLPLSPCRVAGNPVCRPAPGLSTFTRIFLPFSSLSHVRANEQLGSESAWEGAVFEISVSTNTDSSGEVGHALISVGSSTAK
jgi:hypothetical protein